MKIKEILDEIASESSTNQKMVILSKYKDNTLLKRVLYGAESKRIKFYIKQIPPYSTGTPTIDLETAMSMLSELNQRIKTGHEASAHLQSILSQLDEDDAYVIERVIAKDLKIGMGKNINKVIPNWIETTPYQGAISFDENQVRKMFVNNIAFSQEKCDGRYANAIIENGEVEFESRNGESNKLDGAKIINELSTLNDCVLNGELTLDGYNRQIGNGIIASIIDITSKVNTRTTEETTKKRKAFEAKHGSLEEMLTKIRFNVWDIITIDEYYAKSSKTPYNIRFNELISKTEGLSMVSVVESVIVKSYSEAINHFKKLLALGKEGTILKVYDSHWIDGKHSHAIKFKLEMDVDLRIVGYNYGTVGSKNEHVISSIKAQSSDGLLNTQPQGLTEDRMQYITENQDLLLGSIIQVRCNGTSKNVDGDYSLMYPRLIEFRSDKDTCDSLESILQIENMVKELS